MPRFLNTRGRSTLGIGLCSRCSRKFSLDELRRDGDIPGLYVCRADWDMRDPYRNGLRQPDRITLPFVRPDTSVSIDPADATEVLPPA